MITEELKAKLIAVAKEDYDGDDVDDFKVVEEGDWEVQHKYEFMEIIVKHFDKYYGVQFCRSGSYFTDYDYHDPEVYEVVPKVITKTVYVVKP